MDYWEAILDSGIPYENYYDDDEDRYEINYWNYELCRAIVVEQLSLLMLIKSNNA